MSPTEFFFLTFVLISGAQEPDATSMRGNWLTVSCVCAEPVTRQHYASILLCSPNQRTEWRKTTSGPLKPSWNLPSNCRYVFPWHRCLLSISHLQPVRLSARFVSYISVMRIKRRWWQAAERRGFVLALKSDTVWVRDLCSWWSSRAGR